MNKEVPKIASENQGDNPRDAVQNYVPKVGRIILNAPLRTVHRTVRRIGIVQVIGWTVTSGHGWSAALHPPPEGRRPPFGAFAPSG
jgi:hypothetical protein